VSAGIDLVQQQQQQQQQQQTNKQPMQPFICHKISQEISNFLAQTSKEHFF